MAKGSRSANNKETARPKADNGADTETFQLAADTAQNKFSDLTASGSVIADGMQRISRVILECTQEGMQKQMAHINEFAKCKTPSEVYALQTQIFRENVEDFIGNSRRISEVAKAMSEEATRKLKEISKS